MHTVFGRGTHQCAKGLGAMVVVSVTLHLCLYILLL